MRLLILTLLLVVINRGIAVDDVAVDDVAVGDVDAEYINKSIIVLCY